MKKFTFKVNAEVQKKEDIKIVLREIEESIKRGSYSSQSAGDDVFYKFEINEIK